MTAHIVTQKELKEILTYHESSGKFTWNCYRGGKAKKGSVAGANSYRGYIRIGIEGKYYAAHRLVFLYITGKFPIEEVDHINGDKADNRLVNLREVSHLENSRNASLAKNNKTGMTGVFWSKKYNLWMAEIRVGNRKVHLGQSKDFFLVCCARKAGEKKYGFHPNHGKTPITSKDSR